MSFGLFIILMLSVACARMVSYYVKHENYHAVVGWIAAWIMGICLGICIIYVDKIVPTP